MKRSLEVSSYNGKLMAGYLTFGRRPGDESVANAPPEPGLVVDFAADSRPIGLEITSPSLVTLEAINRVLTALRSTGHGAGAIAPVCHARRCGGRHRRVDRGPPLDGAGTRQKST